jgi:predicted nucleic acid-binding protein
MSVAQYFLDANFLIALTDASDLHHARATKLLQQITATEAELFLSDIAVNETLSVLARRHESKKSKTPFKTVVDRFKNAIAKSPILSLYELVPQNYARLMAMMVKYDAKLSFHDCLIVLFLRQVPEVRLVSFDRDFAAVQELKLLLDTK